MNKQTQKTGFTIVELLIIIVVIAILAAISIVAYTGIQTRAKNNATQNQLRQISKIVEAYNADTGNYPSTGSLDKVYTDSNCVKGADSDSSPGYKGVNWIPGINEGKYATLPQSNFSDSGRSGEGGCYAYASDGTTYVLAAWNAKYGGPNTSGMYRRLGFREIGNFTVNLYRCNHVNIGGTSSGSYVLNDDFYKYSYTISNVSNCNEAPPAGA